MISSICPPSSSPVPRMMARLMLSWGILAPLAATMAERSLGFESGSPPPPRAAIMISLMMRVNAFPRLASVAAFLCLMVAHFECPDMVNPWARVSCHGLASEPNRLGYQGGGKSAALAVRGGPFDSCGEAGNWTAVCPAQPIGSAHPCRNRRISRRGEPVCQESGHRRELRSAGERAGSYRQHHQARDYGHRLRCRRARASPVDR